MKIEDGTLYINEIKQLIVEYTSSLQRDLSFQNLAEELDHLEEKYTGSHGQLLAVRSDSGTVCGCVAFRRITEERCEMKRLYVQLPFRHLHMGEKLVSAIIYRATQEGYKEMVLDTLSPMKSAIDLYHSFGFREIPPYYHNPLPDVIYMKLELYK